MFIVEGVERVKRVWLNSGHLNIDISHAQVLKHKVYANDLESVLNNDNLRAAE